MLGLTAEGLRGKIKNNKFVLTENEAIDLFFIYPELTELEWKKGNVLSAHVKGLNLKFSVKD